MAEALVVALTLVAVVAFVRSTSGPAHPVMSTHDAGSPAGSSIVAATTTAPAPVPVPAAPSMATQVSEWWSGTGEPVTSALVADLEAVQTGGATVGGPVASCGALSRDSASATSAPPAPSTAIEREWQLTVSTSTRVSAACQAGRFTSLAGDLQPALYTIRDLSAQIKPYLTGPAS